LWNAIFGIILGVAVSVLTAGAGAPFMVAALSAGIAGGALTGGLGGGLNGALMGMAIGAATGFAMGAMGSMAGTAGAGMTSTTTTSTSSGFFSNGEVGDMVRYGFDYLTKEIVTQSVTQPVTSVATQIVVGAGVAGGVTSVGTVAANYISGNISQIASNIKDASAEKVNDAWWPKSWEGHIPNYGNYGGPSNTDLTFKTKPIDSLDEICMEHDKFWFRSQGNMGDTALLVRTVNLPLNPLNWEHRPPNPLKAIIYREEIIFVFGWKEIIKK